MKDWKIPLSDSPYSPFSALLRFALLVIAAAFVGQFVVFIALLPLSNYDFNEVTNVLQAAMGSQPDKKVLLIAQGITATFTFILAPLAYIKWVEKKDISEVLVKRDHFSIPPLFLMVLFMLFMGPALQALVEWNEAFVFPESLKDLEAWFKEKEANAMRLTEGMLEFTSFGDFLFSFFVIAVLAGVGEEIVFRGLLQPLFYRITKNMHVAIWLTAFIFSAIHFQFYGFFPRMLLGAVFGYFYWWSKDIRYPILAHIFNNGYMVIMTYVAGFDPIEKAMEENTELSLLSIGISIVVSSLILLFFRKNFKNSLNV
ncbi:CPBP family intramembrane glutamic endopeptidase [Sediminitomix flava]|uniref:CAAX prenyl protease 2/Lysostaphin resistance protein A-like domain-containing protein n=1 Tax=Sediminitomix flava TaxID=379075 RepID=A0A315Z649_SEDFL|nr:CPBP family intramembrane glutamic endopeptidase [Sediminitomix flava]PWJ39134.1 hypothetical protein BC781_10635 [Sediminitomix flava]